MRKIASKPVLEYLLSGRGENIGLSEGPNFLLSRHLFSSTVLFSSFFLVLLVSSFYHRSSQVGAATLVCYAIFIFLRTRAVANGLHLKRKIKRNSFTELDEVEVVLEVVNSSAFRVPPGLIIEDQFEASLEAKVCVAVDREIPPYSRVYVSYKRKCDGGMGLYHIGPLLARVTDPQALIEFRVTEDDLMLCEVFPKIVQVPQVHLTGSPESMSYGTYEVAQRGTSVNFAGVRPYALGDSLRHVAWRISAKRQSGLLVKEFERNVSCDVSIILNLDPRLHVGFKSYSTWEVAKDLALGLVSQQVEAGNSVQLLSNQIFVEAGRGETHLQYLCHLFMDLKPSEDDLTDEMENLPLKYLPLIQPGATVFYVTPFDQAEYKKTLPTLKLLVAQNVRVLCVYIDACAFLAELDARVVISLMTELKSIEFLRTAANALELAGIATYVIHTPQDLSRVFLNGTRVHRRREAAR